MNTLQITNIKNANADILLWMASIETINTSVHPQIGCLPHSKSYAGVPLLWEVKYFI